MPLRLPPPSSITIRRRRFAGTFERGPVGSVEVTDNIKVGAAVLDATGKATVPVRFENAGTRSVIATFNGGATYRGATSAPATVTVGKAHRGRPIVCAKADGITFTLPAATGSGDRYLFYVKTTITSGSLIVKVANATDVIQGALAQTQDGGAGIQGWEAGSTHDTITMDGSTMGGIKGDMFELIDMAAGEYGVRGTIAGTGRATSYEELVLGDPVIDPATGLPQTRLRDGEPEIVRGAALVETMAPGVFGMARSSRLGEIIFGENLKASAAARSAHPNPPAGAPDHSTLLNLAEKRVVSEWMDLGGQYYNNLAANGSPVRVARLSQTVFESDVFPILQSDCAICHQPNGNSGAAQTAQSFADNRFVLAGSVEGDFNVTLTMISDVCNGPSSALLRRPSTAPHPSGATGSAAPLPAGGTKYNTIASWIASGCQTQ